MGLMDYGKAWEWQKKTVSSVMNGGPATLLLCEHPPVVTLGRMAKKENFLISPDQIRSQGIRIVAVDRGGDVTVHAPGQIISYPIFNLSDFGRDLRIFLDQLEHVAIDLLQDFGIVARSVEDERGVWVGQEKIASIGIGVKKWVSFHGMAINGNTDLKYFTMIKPCGLDRPMTSLKKLLGKEIDRDQIKQRLIQKYALNFNLELL